MRTRQELLASWEALFARAEVDSPRLSAQVLLAHALGLSRLDMLLSVRDRVDPGDESAMEALARRRLCGEPVAYLVGIREFYGLDFEVNPSVLIPRPESELMIDWLRPALDAKRPLRILDLGTGSGALAVTCAALNPAARVTAVDVSRPALSVARRNAMRHDVLDRVSLVQGDLLAAVRPGAFDIVLANLPYVPESTRREMSREVLEHEPGLALFAGEDGLDLYRRLALAIAGAASPGTTLLCEIDRSHGPCMKEMFAPIARTVTVRKDYAGLDRLVIVVF
jgi:release factor glutamine methyltransferase